MRLADLIRQYRDRFYPGDPDAEFKLWRLVEKGQYSYQKFHLEGMDRDMVTALIRASGERTRWIYQEAPIHVSKWAVIYHEWEARQ